jgi:hypothetical protein
MIDDRAILDRLEEVLSTDAAAGPETYAVALRDGHAEGLPLLVVVSRMCPPEAIAHLIPWSRP